MRKKKKNIFYDRAMKKNIHFIVLAGGLQVGNTSLLIPHSLIPLGHHPMVCILIKTLLQWDNVHVHVLVSDSHETLFRREMRRWFPEKPVHVFASTGQTTSQSILEFLKEKTWAPDHAIHIVQSNLPLLSKHALEHFMHVSAPLTSAVLGVNKTKWNEDRTLRNLVVLDGVVTSIEKSNFTHLGFLACCKFPVSLLLEHLPHCQDYYEMVERCEEKPWLVELKSYPIELDSITVRTAGDKTYAEHKFMEKEHADYLSQCYCIWKECRSMQARIEKLEERLKN